MQIVSIPLFDEHMSVEAYFFRYRKGDELFSSAQAASVFDGASRSDVLETLNYVGLESFSLGKPIFVPINSIMLLNHLETQYSQPPEKMIFLLEDLPKPQMSNEYVAIMHELRGMGYRFAASEITNLTRYEFILQQCDFLFLSQNSRQAERSERILEELKRDWRNVVPVATDVQSAETMRNLKEKGYALFESRFLKLAVTSGETSVSPLKMNSIRLLNTVQDNNFEFEQVARIVQGDPALAISLLQMVNVRSYSHNKIKSIPQAVAMLGQQEVRKWVATAVAKSLGNDRPNEITKISLVRAKFAENLAPVFEMAHMVQGLFLMGLFSALDVILEVPMEKALEMVSVSDMIRNALANQSGVYYPVLNMIVSYENADWVTVSRLMIVHDIDEQALANAYLEAMIWYKNIMTFETEQLESDTEKGV